MRFYEHVGTAYGGWPEWFPPTDDNDDNDANDDGGNDDNDTGGGGTNPDPDPDPNRRILHGIEFEQEYAAHLSNLIPPRINRATVEVLDFARGIYRITIHRNDVTLDPRATSPFFFWGSRYGSFSQIIDDREDYAVFVFSAHPGTSNRNIPLMLGVGDGLGQTDRGSLILKGNDCPTTSILPTAFDNQLPLFFDLPHDSAFSPFFGQRFSDVPSRRWSYNAIMALVDHGAITGFNDGTFLPEQNATMAEFIALLVRVGGIELRPRAGNEDWHVRYMDFARHLDVFNHMFAPVPQVPGDHIERQFAFYLIYRILGSDYVTTWNRMHYTMRPSRPPNYTLPFVDFERVVEPSFRNAIGALYDYRILTGVPSQGGMLLLDPTANFPREQMAFLVFGAITPLGYIVTGNADRVIPFDILDNFTFATDMNHATANELGNYAFQFLIPETGSFRFTALYPFAPKVFIVNGPSGEFDDAYDFTARAQIPIYVPVDMYRVQHRLLAGQHIVVTVDGFYGDGFFLGIELVDDPRPVWPDPLANREHYISSPFGWRTWDNSHHNGVDTLSPIGQPVYAIFCGVVTVRLNVFRAGNFIIIDHYNGYTTRYLHLGVHPGHWAYSQVGNGILVETGQRVQAGEKIGYAGITAGHDGTSWLTVGAHLHFDIARPGGTFFNPLAFYHWDHQLLFPNHSGINPNPLFIIGEYGTFIYNPNFMWSVPLY